MGDKYIDRHVVLERGRVAWTGDSAAPRGERSAGRDFLASDRRRHTAGAAPCETRCSGKAVVHLICSIEKADETPFRWTTLLSFL